MLIFCSGIFGLSIYAPLGSIRATSRLIPTILILLILLRLLLFLDILTQIPTFFLLVLTVGNGGMIYNSYFVVIPFPLPCYQ